MSSCLFHLVVLTVFGSCKALMSTRKLCPKIPTTILPTNATCDTKVNMWNLEALAHIPGGGHSINPYHNPYGPDQSCSSFQFYCRDDLPELLGDLYLVPKTVPNLVCSAISFSHVGSSWQAHIDLNPFRAECNTVEKWTNVELFVYEQNEYIFVYSCKVHEKDTSTEFGAWILVNVNSTVERKQEVLKTGLELFDQIPGFRRDWWVYPRDSVACWKDVNCSYFSNCFPENDLPEKSLELKVNSVNLRFFSIIPVLLFIIVIAVVAFVNCQKRLNRSRVMPFNN